jgi:hypothetical protein
MSRRFVRDMACPACGRRFRSWRTRPKCQSCHKAFWWTDCLTVEAVRRVNGRIVTDAIDGDGAVPAATRKTTHCQSPPSRQCGRSTDAHRGYPAARPETGRLLLCLSCGEAYPAESIAGATCESCLIETRMLTGRPA